MKRLALTIIVGVSSAFISMCNSKDIIFDANSTTFEGIVHDSASGIPVESVSVTPTDTVTGFISLTTDTAGFFEFYDIAGSSDLPFFFRKAGYVPKVCTLQAGQRDTLFIQTQQSIGG